MADLDRLKARAAEIAERETKILLDRTPGSKALHERALKSLPAGVASNFQAGDPYPIYLKRGSGSNVWDVDGTEYTDFHGGFGVNVVGHAHPKIVEAIRKVADQGIHFAVTTETTVALAEEICSRFQLEQMRFVNSGTEATMDAIRVARAATGRDKIIKMEGSYHGHHDSVLFSVVPEADVLGLRHGVEHDKAWYTTEPTSKGIPKALWETVIVVPFNDAEAVEEAFRDNPGEIAAVILEPVMMNIGLVVPKPGYLQALRDACERHGAVLIFDEVKCGGTIAYGGTTERFGVRPHLAAYAKAIGGGATIGAFGGEARVHGVGHEGRRAAGHVQRQPAVGGGRPRGAHRGAHEGRVRAPRQARHAARRGMQARDGRQRHPRRTPWTSARRAASPTARSRSRTTATSWRPSPSSSTRRSRG